jgi:hypothetical protein
VRERELSQELDSSDVCLQWSNIERADQTRITPFSSSNTESNLALKDDLTRGADPRRT